MQIFRYQNVFAVATLCIFSAACAKKPIAVNRPTAPSPAATDRQQPAAPASPVARQTPPQTPAAAAPASRFPDAATRARIDELIGRIQDAYFDYNKHTLREDAVSALNSDSKELAQIMQQYPDYKLKIEGYCDERGSSEYNIALGDARAKAAKDYLVSVGVSGDQLQTVSLGKENQVCTEHDEACWSKNRRVHIVAMAEK